MNKKQIMIMTLLLSLLISLVVIQSFFDDSFNRIILQDNNMGLFKKLSINNTKYKLSIPEKWEVNNDLFYQVEIEDNNNNILVYIQIINTQASTDVMAKKYINKVLLSNTDNNIHKFVGDNWTGTCIDYISKVNKRYLCKNSIYYIDLCDGNIGKIMFSVKWENYKNNMKIIFNEIADSIECANNKDLPLVA